MCKRIENLISVVLFSNGNGDIQTCIESIINQSLIELEIIVSYEKKDLEVEKIKKNYSKEDKRIKIFKVKEDDFLNMNKKLVKKTSGEYICFFKDTFIIDKNYLKDLYDCVVDGNDLFYSDNQPRYIKVNRNLFLEEKLDGLIYKKMYLF